MSKDWLKESIFNRFSIRVIMFFCILIILSNFWKIWHIMVRVVMPNSSTWIELFMGIIFIVFSRYKDLKEEKIGFSLFGLSFILGGLSPFLNQFIILIVTVNLLLESIGTLNFWIAYKKFKQKNTSVTTKTKLTITLLILFIILILPAFILWVVGLIMGK